MLHGPATARGESTEPTARTTGFADLSTAYIALAIQGDLRPVGALFDNAVGAGSAGAALRQIYEERFVAPPEQAAAENGIGEAVARAYHGYWRRNLLREAGETDPGTRLTADLSAALSLHGHAVPAAATAEALTHAALRNSGLMYSVSPAPPWHDLFVWGTQSVSLYRVELTDVVLPVEVVFMEDFTIQGWKDYATLGLATTTGWVEDGRLYCVAWAYDPESENFRVSYLKHEARHLADLQRFRDMETTELEYRAKLTELAFAQQSMPRIWDDFRAKAAENPDSPHALANWRVTRDIARTVGAALAPDSTGVEASSNVRRVNSAARRLLRENTAYHERGRARGQSRSSK